MIFNFLFTLAALVVAHSALTLWERTHRPSRPPLNLFTPLWLWNLECLAVAHAARWRAFHRALFPVLLLALAWAVWRLVTYFWT